MTLNCPACGKGVRGEPDPRDVHLIRCAECGLSLTRQPASVLGRVAIKRVRAEDLPDGPVVMGSTLVEPEEDFVLVAPQPQLPRPPTPPPRSTPFRCAVIAEDLELHRELIRDGLLQAGIAEQVVVTGRGDEFLTAMTRGFLNGHKPDLAILDLEMPGLGGYHTAVALRAIEEAFGRSATPVLFFTSRACDEVFRRALGAVGTAGYLNKATQSGPEEFIGRLAQVLRTFRGQPALSG